MIDEIRSVRGWACVLPCEQTLAIDSLMRESTSALSYIVGQREVFGHCISQKLTERVSFFVYIVKAVVPLYITKLCIKPRVFRTPDLRLCQNFPKVIMTSKCSMLKFTILYKLT